MHEIEPWFRLCLCLPHIVAPFLGVRSAEMLKVFTEFPELQRAGWIALVVLSGDAIRRIAGF
jgi:hypothetical protein